MKIKETSRRTRIHHTVVVDKIPYNRNETLEYDTNGILVNQRVLWSVGDEKGKGPFVEPGGPLDHLKKQTHKSLEKKFKSLGIK